MKDRYKTVTREASAEICEKRSRFIAAVKPIETEDEAISFLEKIKKENWDARHNVYAYVLEENNIQRYSDDGEPAGTAGLPVLDCIRKEGLSNVIVVVTRYFGGILLGTGGLVHAYSKSAKAGLEAAEPSFTVLCRILRISCEYSLLGKIKNEIYASGALEEDICYSDSIDITIAIPESGADKFIASLIDKTNGCVKTEKLGVEYKKNFSEK